MHIHQRLLLLLSHTLLLGVGFVGGIYMLPLLIAATPPSELELAVVEDDAVLVADFDHKHPASDFLHWGNGRLYLSDSAAGFTGALSPAPDLVLYVSSTVIETPEDFIRERSRLVSLGRIRSFKDFLVPFTQPLDLSEMKTAIIWCDSYNQFISAATLTHL